MAELPIRQAVILVGGKGTRLGDLTRDLPKPLMDIDGRPFLDYLLEMVARHGYGDIILLAGHLGGVIEQIYHGRRLQNAVVRVLREDSPHGTAGALTSVRHVLDDDFLMMNGDALFDINLRALEVSARAGGAVATIALKTVDDVSRYGSVEECEGRVVNFSEKNPDRRGPGKINGGIYVLKRGIVDSIQQLPCSMEGDIFPRLVGRGQILGWNSGGYFIDIGIPESLERGRQELPLLRKRPAAFLDRDGVINFDKGYTFRPEDLRFLPGAVDAIRYLNDTGRLVIVVTNQAGVARGFYTLDDVHRFNSEIQSRLAAHGAHIDQFYVAPYHPDGSVTEYAVNHADRKPNPGMLIRAFTEWPIEIDRSFLIGDKLSDMEAANRAGIPGYLFEHGSLDDLVRRILPV
jgi:D-glycero-D-manno-heptose 1,7-bisphosphate phosphatase